MSKIGSWNSIATLIFESAKVPVIKKLFLLFWNINELNKTLFWSKVVFSNLYYKLNHFLILLSHEIIIIFLFCINYKQSQHNMHKNVCVCVWWWRVIFQWGRRFKGTFLIDDQKQALTKINFFEIFLTKLLLTLFFGKFKCFFFIYFVFMSVSVFGNQASQRHHLFCTLSCLS